jgi:hypothetical protein
MGTLKITNGPAAGRVVEVTEELVIGREGTDIEIDDPELSRRHAAVRPTDPGVEVEDLGSLNGTFVDGSRIDGVARLSASAIIRIGNTEIALELAPPPAPPPDVTRARPAPEVPEPDVTRARPVQETPEFDATRARPVAETPEPNVTRARPVAETPEPNVTRARPVAEVPEPDVTRARPVREPPEPDVTAARPIPEAPEPDAAARPRGAEQRATGAPSVNVSRRVIALGIAIIVIELIVIVLLLMR